VGLGLPPADAVVLADEPPTAAYFDAVLEAGAPPKPAANWVMGDIMAFCKARQPRVLAGLGPAAGGRMNFSFRRTSLPTMACWLCGAGKMECRQA